jgi:inosose dehydratase
MKVRIATAPVSWGVIMKDTPNVPPWKQVLTEIAEAGYTGTELGPYGFLPQDKDLLQSTLDELGLTLLSAFVQINLVDIGAKQEEYDETLRTTKLLSELGCEWVVLSDALFVNANRAERAGRVRVEDGMTDEQWKSYIQSANDYGKLALEEYGLKVAYHPHVAALVETGAEVDRLMNETDDKYVNLCLDTAHCMYGGDDPIDLAKRWGSRVKYLHLKECDMTVLETVRANEWDYFKGVEVNVFPELGKGSVDFPALLEVLTDIDFDGWAVVEQDILPESGVVALDSAKGNRAYLESIGLG